MQNEVMEKIYRWILKKYRIYLESKIDRKNFDTELSYKIDYLNFFLDS